MDEAIYTLRKYSKEDLSSTILRLKNVIKKRDRTIKRMSYLLEATDKNET